MITDYFTQAITTKRKTAGQNTFGGRTASYSNYLSFNGLIDYISGQKQQIATQYTDKATHILMCEAGKDITIFDEVYYNSQKYRVLHVDTPFGRHMEILLEYVGVDNNG